MDRSMPKSFGPESLESRAGVKRALVKRLGLAAAADALVGVVGRLVPQKGFDVLVAAAPALLSEGCALVVLGAGDPELVGAVRDLERRHPGRTAVHVGDDDDLAHLIVAGSDLLPLPPRDEPCGVGQMDAPPYRPIPGGRQTRRPAHPRPPPAGGPRP